PDKGGEKAYRLLADAMGTHGRVALAKFVMRGKESLVLIRPAQGGLMLHTMYFADEVRSFGEIEKGESAKIREGELQLALQLIDGLSGDAFSPEKYRDEYREHVLELVNQKVEGKEVTAVGPEVKRAQVIDLMEALKQSLAKRVAAQPARAVREAAAERRVDGRHLFRRRVPECQAEDRRVFPHGPARIDLDGPTVADDDDAAEARHHVDVLLEVDVREHLEDHVRAVVAGELHELLEIVGCRVIEDLVSAVLLDEPAPALGSGGADDGHAVGHGELNRRDADAARGAVDEERFAGTGVSLVMEAAVRGAVRHAHRGAL